MDSRTHYVIATRSRAQPCDGLWDIMKCDEEAIGCIGSWQVVMEPREVTVQEPRQITVPRTVPVAQTVEGQVRFAIKTWLCRSCDEIW